MANKITLDKLRENIEAKYGEFEIELSEGKSAKYTNVLRLTKEARQKLLDFTKADESDGEDADFGEKVAEALASVTTTPKAHDELIKIADGDLAMLLEIFQQYTSSTQLGEA